MSGNFCKFNIFVLALLCTLQSCGFFVHGLYCFKCLSLSCEELDKECNQLRTFAESQLKDFYDFNETMPTCPEFNDTESWKQLKPSNESCPDNTTHPATCTLGRLKIKSLDKGPFGTSTDVRYSFSTVLGCASDLLLDRIQSAYQQDMICDYRQNTTTSFRGRVVHTLEIEHCPDPKTWCRTGDYCPDLHRSVVTMWNHYWVGYTRQDYQLRQIILVFLLAGVVVLMYGFYKDPAGESLTCLKLVKRRRRRPPVQQDVMETSV